MEEIYPKARSFIYRNARPLDLTRWQYHFENGSKEAVLNALSYYQNEDGGFAHALEPDIWNPASAPIPTWVATEILREIDFSDSDHPLIQGILHYLASGQDFQGHLWYNTVKSNKDYPHAFWWHADSDSTHADDYNPTACLAGFILLFADKQSSLYQKALMIAQEALDQLYNAQRTNDMHTLLCYLRLLEYSEKAGLDNILDLNKFREEMRQQVSNSIDSDINEWDLAYVTKPSRFLNSKNSLFYEDNQDIADYECTHIIKTQLNDGFWHIPWEWNDYPEQWAISKNWWKADAIIKNLLYLYGINSL